MKIINVICLVTLLFCSTAYGKEKDLWESYKSRFISSDGRVIDFSNEQISHSEGQGYGMMLAVTFNDKKAFDKLWEWTELNLSKRDDNLFSWRWGKRANDKWAVLDYNNATDGDIMIAHALLEAGKRWRGKKYKKKALSIVSGIRNNLAVNWNGDTFLLPGYFGFTRERAFVLNPSYFIFSAFRNFAQEDNKDFWEKVYNDRLSLINRANFGKLNLPPDWLMLDDRGISIFSERGTNYGLDAVRTLLHLAWEKDPKFPEGVGKILDMYKKIGYIPLQIDLNKESFSLKHSPAGCYAIYALAAKKMGEETLSRKLFEEAREKLNMEKNNYYSFSLYLLATTENI